MKIDGGLTGTGGLRPEDSKTRRSKQPTPKSSDASANDKTELSSASTQLPQLENYLSSLDGIDMAKVEAVRQSIADGTFSVNEDAIAKKLLNNVIEGLRRQTK